MPAAQAGPISACASQNLSGYVLNDSYGSSVDAFWSANAHSEVTRTTITATAYGDDGTAQTVNAASGGATTSYTLWNLSTDSALDGGVSAGLTLVFDFSAAGATLMLPIDLSTATTSMNATLYSVIISGFGTGLSMVYGPTGFLYTGNLGWTARTASRSHCSMCLPRAGCGRWTSAARPATGATPTVSSRWPAAG